jgi:hypothetical protein
VFFPAGVGKSKVYLTEFKRKSDELLKIKHHSNSLEGLSLKAFNVLGEAYSHLQSPCVTCCRRLAQLEIFACAADTG